MGAYEDIVALEDEALAASTQHRYDAALERHNRAMDLARQLNRPRLTAALFHRNGRVYESKGEIQNAVTTYESALWELIDDPEYDIRLVLSKLNSVHKQHIFSKTIVPYLYSPVLAADLATAEASRTLAIDLLLDIGNAYLRQPQVVPALAAYQLALERPEIADAPLRRAYVCANIAEIYRRQGKLTQAAEELGEVLQLLETHAELVEQRQAFALQAAIAHDRKQLDAAEQTYERALQLYAKVNDPLGHARTLVGLGRLLLEQHRFGEAEIAYNNALELIKVVDDHETRWHISWGLGRCQRHAGNLAAAVASLQESWALCIEHEKHLRTDEGKVAFLDSVQELCDELVAVYLESSRYNEALRFAEERRARALQALMEFKERKQLGSAIERPSDLPSQMAQSAGGIVSGPVDLERQSARAVESVAFASGPRQPVALAITPTNAPAAQPMPRLVFHVLADRTAIFVVAPDGAVRGHVTDLGREALAEQVAQLRQALGTNDPRGLRQGQLDEPEESSPVADPLALCRTLFAALIAPVMDALPTDGAPLVIEPHASLWLLPFAALLGPGDRWLADLWPILCTPSAPVLDQIRSEQDYGNPSTLKALVVGNPVMPTVPTHDGLTISLEPLPGAEEEARSVAKMFDDSRCTLLVGAHADRETVQTEAQRHGIVHLATHGVAYANDPLASFVALAAAADGSGLLTARDVIQLSLPADLVTLSACQTGLGLVSGDGMIGLSRAFLVAGARSVLVSLWSVSDQATRLLMENFYRNYLASDNKAIALQRAMQAVRAMPEYQEPRYWASFVVVGAEA